MKRLLFALTPFFLTGVSADNQAACPETCFNRGAESKPECMQAGYATPAAIEINKGWNTFFTASYLYYEAIQGGMDLAVPVEATIASGSASDVYPSALGYPVLVQDFAFKSGFQVGLGWICPNDQWVLYAEYTWLHGTTHTNATAPSPNVATINGFGVPQSGLWNPASWYQGRYFDNIYPPFISSAWNYKIDLVDVQVSRPYYASPRITVDPFFGLRGAFIRQSLDLNATELSYNDNIIFSPVWEANYASHANGIGPRFGANGNCYLGYGIKLIGNAAASLLFTGYHVSQDVTSPDADTPLPVRTTLKEFSTLRPNLDISLGLGWDTYSYCQKFHWNIEAVYDFSIFWEQNMMRYLADLVGSNYYGIGGGSAGNLYLQGLIIKTGFNF